ncbi:hypothetical protein L6270_01780 [Candidatus Parcubacteria bacterium]|nr:hypothetical protein [Patescibacteria group bacterium]MBU4309870.1 hypothetical protein [Patescibacteria group bacterium]MBU4431719.1 hypothetical protein [Patescibacteria group bacterium]MBU4578209.1 hypothetical protein [Patescibacteria group bacterium]MCG2696745.1 hypothetical protein [Candidatus Parcubacteria bacterium]
MENSQTDRNIKLFKIFKMFSGPLFWGPVLISYIVNVGKMSLADIYTMEAIVVTGMIFMEVYSSGWADLLGRKKTVILGSALQAIALIIFTIAASPASIWIANILIMIGGAIISGADEAFLVDTLKDAGRFDELTKINRDIGNKVFAMITFSSVAAGYLYSINPRLPMILSIPGVLLAFVVTFFFYEPRTTEKSGHREHFDLIKMSVLFVANNKKVKWIIAYIALIAVASKIWFFSYNPYFELTMISPKYFGWIFFSLNFVAWQANKHAHVLENKFSERTIITILVLLISVPIILFGNFVAQISILFLFGDSIVRGFKRAFFSRLINEHLDSKNRATVLSIQSASESIVGAIGLWIFGIGLKIFSLPSALQIHGLAMLIIGLLIISQYRKIFRSQ